MSYRKIYLEWEVTDIQIGVPVAFEVEFSRDRHFHEITTTFSTFDAVNPYGASQFWYSLDNGNTWIPYPYGSGGQVFVAPFRMRLEIVPSDSGYVLSFYSGSLKKISADSKAVINYTTLVLEDIVDIDQYSDILYLVGSQTLYKIDGETLEPYDNSLSLLNNNVVGAVVDEGRGTFWQINQNTIYLRSLYGDILWSANIPEILDTP